MGKQEPFLHRLVPAVVAAMRNPYPELAESAVASAGTIREEEEQFLGIIDRGLSRFERIVERCRASSSSVVTGEEAFELHTQEGFLIEMTEAMAARHNLSVDSRKFQKLLDQHRETSGRGTFSDAVMAEGPLDALRKTAGGSLFLGYEVTEASASVVGIIAERHLVESVEEVGHVDPIALVLDRTPFYGESGGQVGDSGSISTLHALFEVIDTQRDGDLILHIGHLRQGRLRVGDKVEAEVQPMRRAGIRRAHSATHLLHHSLRLVVGTHAQQRGSKVENDLLRFDFAHKGPLSPDELRRVEDEINSRIAEGAIVTTELTDQKSARDRGAMMLFGEKYPDTVRMVTMGDFSVELCGGTHVSNTGQVGLCRVISEEPVAKGVRRIVACTGFRALERIRESESVLRSVAQALKLSQPAEAPQRIAQLQEEVRELKQQLSRYTQASVAESVQSLLESAEAVGDVKIVCRRLEGVDRETLREYADQLRAKGGSVALLLAAEIDGKVALLAAVTKDLVQKGVKAGDCIRDAAKAVGGGGGGRPDLAEAGGKEPDRIPDALASATEYYRAAVTSLGGK
jgi:alanyl-tRNA synthetase